MADILEEIVAWKRREVQAMKEQLPTRELQRIMEEQAGSKRPFIADALRQSSTGIIAEFKRKSPSLGWIHEDARPSDVPLAYQQNGAAAVSILTDSHYFGGDDEYIREARRSGVRIPVLYKNFIIDEHQLFQAYLAGASTVLLIAACLKPGECRQLMQAAHDIGLEVLLEMHSEAELEYAGLEPDLCGINNRHLGTFHTDVETSFRLAELLPDNTVKVSESGISNPATIRHLREVGYQGFLIGEAFMKHENPGAALADFIADI